MDVNIPFGGREVAEASGGVVATMMAFLLKIARGDFQEYKRQQEAQMVELKKRVQQIEDTARDDIKHLRDHMDGRFDDVQSTFLTVMRDIQNAVRPR